MKKIKTLIKNIQYLMNHDLQKSIKNIKPEFKINGDELMGIINKNFYKKRMTI